jgi:hypothetical protein
MSAFSVAWQLLKSRYSEKDILDFKEKLRREAESGYASDRGNTGIEHLMGMRGLGQETLFGDSQKGPTPLSLSRGIDASKIAREFERGYKDRMNPKPISRPTKVRLTGDGHSLDAHLVDDDNNIFSTLEATARGMGPQDFEMYDIHGGTTLGHQRQGHYGNLMNTLLQHGIGIHSDSRNNMSQPFHEKFQQNLAPNIHFAGSHMLRNKRPPPLGSFGFIYPDEQAEPVSTKGDSFRYSRKPNIESPEGWGSLQPDYGQYPLVNEAQLRESREPYKPTRQSKLTEEQVNPVIEQDLNLLSDSEGRPIPEYARNWPIDYQDLYHLLG